MNQNTLMTVGAIGFAGFALWYIARKPGGEVAAQPGQRTRDAGLVGWFNHLDAQQSELSLKTMDDYMDDLERRNMLIRSISPRTS